MIKLLRIDDRLLHGQVSFYWTEYLSLQTIIIVNDEAASDDFTRMILEFAKPKEILMKTMMMSECEPVILKEAASDENAIIIVGNLVDAQIIYRILKKGTRISFDVNLGGLRIRPNSIQVTDFLFLTSEDVKIIHWLLHEGAEVSVRRVPSDPAIRIQRYLPSISSDVFD